MIIIVVVSGLFNYVGNSVDMYYSNLAPQQFENDNVYGQMKFHGTVNTIVWLVYLLLLIFLFRRIYLVLWSDKKKEEAPDKK